MKKNAVIICIACMLICPGVAAFPKMIEKPNVPTFRNGNTLYVGGTGDGNYSSIQDAVDDAVDGDTVFVYSYSSPYYENVMINKPINLIGEDKDTTIVDGGNDIVLQVEKQLVTIKEFTLQNNGLDWVIAVQLIYAPHHKVYNISISDCILNKGAILFNNVSDSSITNCYLKDGIASSIRIIWSSENIMVNNCTIDSFGYVDEGGGTHPGDIQINGDKYECSNISIFNCNIFNIAGNGVSVAKAKNVDIYDNNIYRNTWAGISLANKIHDTTIHNNNIYENTMNGIAFYGSGFSNIQVYNNNILRNGNHTAQQAGIYIKGCSNGINIFNNKISSNKPCGILLWESSNNMIFENNFILNEYSIFLHLSSDNMIFENNFIFNFRNEFFFLKNSSHSNFWKGNYWNRPRILPKPIFGRHTDRVEFDWRPALLPNRW